MSIRKIIPYVAGLGGCASLAWAIRGLLLTGSCGDVGQPPCPPEALWYIAAGAGGIVVPIIAVFAGARLLFPGPFLSIAGGSVWAGAQLPPGARTVPLMLAGMFGAIVLVPLAILPFIGLTQRRATRLMTEGAEAVGTVTGTQDTGVTINDNPRVRLTLRIKPLDGSAAFQGEKSITVSRLALPYRGQRFSVRFDPADRRTFVLGAELEAVGGKGAGSPGDPLDRLAKLNELRLAGALTDAEFEAQKLKILADQS